MNDLFLLASVPFLACVLVAWLLAARIYKTNSDNRPFRAQFVVDIFYVIPLILTVPLLLSELPDPPAILNPFIYSTGLALVAPLAMIFALLVGIHEFSSTAGKKLRGWFYAASLGEIGIFQLTAWAFTESMKNAG